MRRFALFGVLVVACGVSPVTAPHAGLPSSGLLVVDSDYVSTNVAAVAWDGTADGSVLASNRTTAGVTAALSGNVVVPLAQPANELVVLDRDAGVVTWLTRKDGAVAAQLSLGDFGSDPEDYVEVAGKAYITRQGKNHAPTGTLDRGSDVAVVDLASRSLTAAIDLDGFVPAASGADPAPAPLLVLDGLVFVSLEGFVDLTTGKAVDDVIAAIDPGSDSVVASTTIVGVKNCGALVSPADHVLAALCGGEIDARNVSAATPTSALVVLREDGGALSEITRVRASDLGAHPFGVAFAAIDDHRFVAATLGNEDGTDTLFVIDTSVAPATAVELAQTPSKGIGFGAVVCHGDRCFVADGASPDVHGSIRVLDVAGDSVALAAPLGFRDPFGLAPRFLAAFLTSFALESAPTRAYDASVSPPLVVGRYSLDQLLRPDVDPSTWRAHDRTANRDVLVCLVANEIGAAARSRRALVHPALAPVLDVVRMRDGVSPPLPAPDPRGDTFVVTPLPESASLAARVAESGALEAPDAVRMTLALANALVALEKAGSVHGSVMPDAIEYRAIEDGGPRLGMRGVSDVLLAYASPSRICDGGPSRHDDAWALLGVLYFAVAGAPPFAAESPQALARRILGGRPVPIRTTGAATEALQKIFDRGFSRTASQRYPDVTALRADLRSWLAAHGDPSLAIASVPPTRVPIPADDVPRDEMPRTSSKEPPPVVENAEYPPLHPSGRRERHSTIPWGATAAFGASSPPPDEPTKTDPAANAPDASVAETSIAEPRAVLPSKEDLAATVPPSAPAAIASLAAGPTEETVRFSREEMALLESEKSSASDSFEVAESVPKVEAAATDTALATAPGEPTKRSPPTSTPPASAVAPANSNGARAFALAFVAGLAIALAIGVLVTRKRSPAPAPAAPPPATTNVFATTTSPPPPRSAEPPLPPIISAPSSSPSPSPAVSSMTLHDHAASTTACVAKWFPPDSFADDADLAFVCAEASLRAGTRKLQRAIVAGGRGRRVTEAMREWASYHWFDSAVYATLRQVCCPAAAPIELPTSAAACPSPREALEGLAAATAAGAPLDEPIRAFRRVVGCLASAGDSATYGQSGPLDGGEETAFRAFVARGRK